MSLRIKKGDTIEVLTGSEKGKRGKIVKVWPSEHKVMVEGVNLKKKHTRAKKAGQKGSIVEYPAPLPLAKVALVCPECGSKTRVGFRSTKEVKLRFCKKCKQEFV